MTQSGIVIIGSTGMLGRELTAACRRRGTEARAVAGPDELDITDEQAVRQLVARERPSVVINATGYTDGTTRDVSGGGVLMDVNVPDPDWIPGLLTERIFLGVELDLPGEDEPVRALTRAAWVQAEVQAPDDSCLMGLRFKEITRDDLDRVFKYVIMRQLT